MPEIIGEYVDRLCTIEMELNLKGRPRDKTRGLYDIARARQGRPLTYLAARALAESVGKGDNVIFLTGAGMPPYLPNGETDGPLGVASLARAVHLGLGGRAVVITEDRCLAPTLAACKAAGLDVQEADDGGDLQQQQACFVPFASGERDARQRCLDVLDRFAPKAVVAIEKTGPNDKGVFHTVRGFGVDADTQLHVHHLVAEARKRGIATIGIGDGGNEIGFGLVLEDVRDLLRWGRVCQCPCKGGVATCAATDVLIAAAISNWGAYGVAACLAFMLNNIDLVQDAETERNMLIECVKEGAFDGVHEAQVESVDATSMEVQTSFVTMLTAIVENGLTRIK